MLIIYNVAFNCTSQNKPHNIHTLDWYQLKPGHESSSIYRPTVKKAVDEGMLAHIC